MKLMLPQALLPIKVQQFSGLVVWNKLLSFSNRELAHSYLQFWKSTWNYLMWRMLAVYFSLSSPSGNL